MKQAIVMITVGMLAATLCTAEPQPKEALAGELLKAMDFQGQLEKSMSVIKEAMPQQMEQNRKMMGMTNAAAASNYEDGFGQVFEMIFASPEWKQMEHEMALIYADVFTEKEMTSLIAFFNTPEGKSYVQKQPEIMKRSMTLNQKMMMSIMPRLQQQMQKMAAPKVGTPIKAAK